MKQKVRQNTGFISPRRMNQYRTLIHKNVVTNDGTIDSLKEEITKVVLKWLNNWVGEDKGKGVKQIVNVNVDKLPGGDPPENPTMVNIITMVINCQNSNNNSDETA